MWQSQTTLTVFQRRAQILQKIRVFFEQKNVLEIDVPILGQSSVTDPYLDALTVVSRDSTSYLQTSPEYYMKRLLASGVGSIYYMGKAFRAEESGRIHSPEFTMLEWYRLGMNDDDLMAEVTELVLILAPDIRVIRMSYQEAFLAYVGVDPYEASASVLSDLAKKKLDVRWEDDDVNTWLDVLFTHCVEPNLGEGLVAVYDYPASQCALAKLAPNKHGVIVAKRFEFFINGVELANGYWELTDAEEQVARFEKDNQKRVSLGKPFITPDVQLIDALKAGLPECSGVALGIDRLVMALLSLESISQQQSF